jgi:hypothetical protein
MRDEPRSAAVEPMEQLPFNSCDYRCEHCLVTAECAVFRKLQEHSLQYGNDDEEGNDLDSILRDMRESFRETEVQIKQKARELGIDIDEIAGGTTAEEIREQHQSIEKDPLYKRSYGFTMLTHGFLQAADGVVDGEAREFLDDIAWHHTVVSAKVYRALGWRTHEEDAIDAKRSAAVAIKSLTICIMAFDYLASRYPALSQECGRLSTAARQIKEEIRERIKPADAA